MVKLIFSLLLVTLLSACVVLPVTDKAYYPRCELSSDKKTLKIVNVAEATDGYYSLQGYILSPILIPTSFILSGTYMLVNNVYHLGEKKVVCGKGDQPTPN